MSERDCNTPDGLEVKWVKLELFAALEHGRQTLGEGSTVRGGTKIGLQSTRTAKQFLRGDRITFNAQEFVEVCSAILFFGRDLVENLETYGKARGVQKQNDISASPSAPLP